MVVVVSRDKSAECLPLGISAGSEIWICCELKLAESVVYVHGLLCTSGVMQIKCQFD